MTSKGFTTAEFDGQFGKFLTREEQDFDVGQFLDRLRYSPQQWARYPEPVHRPTVIERIRRHHWPNQIPGEFQVKSASAENVPEPAYKWMYVKYVGPRPEEADWLPPRPVGVELDFQDPPNRASRVKSPMRKFLEQVKHYPGVWCRTKDPVNASSTTAIIRGAAYGQKPNTFDAVARSVPRYRGASAVDSDLYMYVMFLDPKSVADQPGAFDPIPETDRLFEFEICPNLGRRSAYLQRQMEFSSVSKSPVAQWLNQTVRNMPPERWAIYPWPHTGTAARGIKNGSAYGARPGEFEVEVADTIDAFGDRAKTLMVRKTVKTDSGSTSGVPALEEFGVKHVPTFEEKMAKWPMFTPDQVAVADVNNQRRKAILEAGLWDELEVRHARVVKPVHRYTAVQLHMLESGELDLLEMDKHARSLEPARAEEFLDEVTASVMLCGIEVVPEDFGPLDEDGVPFGPRLEKWLEWELPPDPWI